MNRYFGWTFRVPSRVGTGVLDEPLTGAFAMVSIVMNGLLRGRAAALDAVP